MRLLLDQNLSRRLVGMLRDAFPGSVHVLDVELDAATDQEVWDYARIPQRAAQPADQNVLERRATDAGEVPIVVTAALPENIRGRESVPQPRAKAALGACDGAHLSVRATRSGVGQVVA